MPIVLQSDDCSIDEDDNEIGPGRCEDDYECTGERTCNWNGYCTGTSNCETDDDDDDDTEVEEVLDQCEIDETDNELGEGKCISDDECLGDRTCNNYFNCEGDSSCSSSAYETYLDLQVDNYAVFRYYDKDPERRNHHSYVVNGNTRNPGIYGMDYESTYEPDSDYNSVVDYFNYDYMNYNYYNGYSVYFDWEEWDVDEEFEYFWGDYWPVPFEESESTGELEFERDMTCSECLRANHMYCVSSSIYGYQFDSSTEDEPTGVCCHDKYNCPARDSGLYSCSDEYADGILQL